MNKKTLDACNEILGRFTRHTISPFVLSTGERGRHWKFWKSNDSCVINKSRTLKVTKKMSIYFELTAKCTELLRFFLRVQ